MPIGYDKDGKIVENEAAVVKYVFEKFNEYSKNPPADMVEDKIEAEREHGEELTYDKAAERVTMYEIECRIWDELRSKPEFAEAIISYNRRIGFDSTPNKIIGEIRNSGTATTEPIISKELWEQVQAARAPKVAVYMRTGSASSESKSGKSLEEQKIDMEHLKAVKEDISGRAPITIFVRESNHNGADGALQKQSERLAAYCEANGYLVYDEFSVIGSRQESLDALREAIECAKETESKAILMASSNRVVGTREELEAITELLNDAGVTIVTMDGSYEQLQRYGVSASALIESTLSSCDDDIDEDEDEGFDISM